MIKLTNGADNGNGVESCEHSNTRGHDHEQTRAQLKWVYDCGSHKQPNVTEREDMRERRHGSRRGRRGMTLASMKAVSAR